MTYVIYIYNLHLIASVLLLLFTFLGCHFTEMYITGKRPRDLLNPKAVKYMQEVFALKDAISKKESREISAQFGVTVTQVPFILL